MRGRNPCSHRLEETTNPSAFIGQRGDRSWAWGRQAGAVKAGERQCHRIGQKERGSFHNIPCGCRRPRPLKRGRPSKQVSTESKCSSYAKPNTAPNAPEAAEVGDSVGSESAAPAGELERWNIDASSSPRRSQPDPIHSGQTRNRPNRLLWGWDRKTAPSLSSFQSQKSRNRSAAEANRREVPVAAEPEPSMPLRRPRGVDRWLAGVARADPGRTEAFRNAGFWPHSADPGAILMRCK